MKKFLVLFILYFSLVGITSAQGLNQTNAGFVSGIWYSKTPFFAGETIRIYSAVQNQSGFDITGTIKFFNNGEIIGESDFSAINGRLVEKWIDWKVTKGSHKIQAKIFNTKKSTPSGGEETISLISGSSDINEQFADLDTDNDGVGDQSDNDDDGDGITDSDEIKEGTDPLDPKSFTKKEEEEQDTKTTKVIETSSKPKTPDTTVETVVNTITNTAKSAGAGIVGAVNSVAGSGAGKLTEVRDRVKEKLERNKRSDINSDGKVDIFDFNLLMVDWGGTNSRSDVDGDGKVGILDFNAVIVNWSL